MYTTGLDPENSAIHDLADMVCYSLVQSDWSDPVNVTGLIKVDVCLVII